MHPIDWIYRVYSDHPIVTTDSRDVPAGSVFFALKGDSFDGNSFALAALEKGAAFAVVDDPALPANDRFILVENVLQSLQDLASFHRSQFRIPVISITGTNGKTTTKELISMVLSEKYQTLATKGNLNNHIGVPLTLLGITRETGIAIVEMGANHIGEISDLCRIANPTHGIITNIGKAHLEGFGGFEGVVRAKSELYQYIRDANGTLFVNYDNSLLISLSQEIQRISYGQNCMAEIRGEMKRTDPFLSVSILLPEGETIIDSHLYGSYNFDNIIAAAAIGAYFDVPAEQIKKAIESYHPANNRSQVVQSPRSNTLILDAYNANPSSMALAILEFAASSFPQKVLVLGDMLELGKESDHEHEAILGLVGEKGFQRVFLVGPVFSRVNTRRTFTCFQDVELAGLWFDHHKITNSAILLKGSRGIKMEKLIDLF